MIDIEAIKARLAAATHGPWYVDESLRGVEAQTYGYPIEIVARTGRADAVLIAHAPGDIAALIAEVERLREGEDGYRQGHSDGCEDERAAVVEWLRYEAEMATGTNTMAAFQHAARLDTLADDIERGEHRRKEEP
jgi:hypothetical protein